MDLADRLALPEGYRCRGSGDTIDIVASDDPARIAAAVRAAAEPSGDDHHVDVAIDPDHVHRRPLFDALVVAAESHVLGVGPSSAAGEIRAGGPPQTDSWFAELGYRRSSGAPATFRKATRATVTVRGATVGDALAVATAHTRAWEVGYRGRIADSLLDDPALGEARRTRWTDRLRNGAPDGAGTINQVFVPVLDAGDGPEVVGFGHVGREASPPSGDTPLRGEVYGFYVHPRAWATDAANELMASCLAHLRDHDVTSAVLWVLEDNPRARRFYERTGWRPTNAPAEMFACAPVPGGPPLPEPVPEIQYGIDL